MASLPHVMILHSGGVRSLVATAMVLHRPQRSRPILLFADDGRPTALPRMKHVRQQADHYRLTRIDEIALPHLYGRVTSRSPDGLPRTTLGVEQLLLAAGAHALDRRAEELLWPIAEDAQAAAVARAHARQIRSAEMIDSAAAETGGSLSLTMPLLGYSDRQVVELGAELAVPWEAAWSCANGLDEPCASCPACRRRIAAFRAAGVVDPAYTPAGVR